MQKLRWYYTVSYILTCSLAPKTMTTKPNVIVVNEFHPETLAKLDSLYNTHHLWQLDEAEKRSLISTLEGSCEIAASASWVCDPLVYKLNSLKLIAAFGVGVDGIDFTATRSQGIRVSNTPDVLNDGVADLAMALILATMRNLVNADSFSRSGSWSDGPFPFGSSMADKTLGIAGLGRIGEAIVDRALPFKVDIAYHNRNPRNLPFKYYPTLQALAEASDILLCMLPGGEETDNVINAGVLEHLGPNGIFINVGRGNAVDDSALIEALTVGKIKAAGLDVYRNEPWIPDAYKSLDNVILLPHIGSATVETRREMGNLVLQNIASFLGDGSLATEVK